MEDSLEKMVVRGESLTGVEQFRTLEGSWAGLFPQAPPMSGEATAADFHWVLSGRGETRTAG